jgi:XTP/dITP diphosphohydrolase
LLLHERDSFLLLTLFFAKQYLYDIFKEQSIINMKIVIATKNEDKIREIMEKFKPLKDIEIISLSDFKNPPHIIEDGRTYQENALKKAQAIAAFTKLPALADDSGLEIDALNGEPGVYSARYAGENKGDEERNLLILEKMRMVPDNSRTARFRCVIAVALHGKHHTLEGICEGFIAHEMKGNNGFGYDPIFYVPELRKTMAELTLSEKNRISHRARALDKARELLGEKLHITN